MDGQNSDQRVRHMKNNAEICQIEG